MNKHTPGPWNVDENQHGLPVIESVQGTVAHVRMHQQADAFEVDANARLLAAAPELLAACESVEQWLTDYQGAIGVLVRTQLLNAIAKAVGE